VKENGFHNEQIDRICDSIDKQYRVPLVNYPSVQPVACLGPAGVGKSSTINSILHQRGAAAESDSSQRGTNLIHEFSAAPATQMARFVVAACYFSDRQIENLVVTHCDNIFAYLKQREIEGDDEDAEDDEESRRPYDAAIDLFRILLPHLGEFETNDRAEEYFDANVAKKDHVKQEVYKCIINVKQSRNLDQGIEYFEAQNAKELAEVFRQVSGVAKSANTRSKASHPWPIIRKVEVRLDHALLDAGLVIADTPGITDSNQVVVNTTTNYIKMAGTILLFESIKRLSHSATLDSNLRELIRLGKVRETIIVVTGIDHLTVADENREELSGLHRDALEEAEVMVIDLKKKEKETQDALFSSSMQSTAGTPEFQKLMKDFQDMPKNVALAEARLSQVMMEIKIALALADLDDKLKKLNLSRYRTDLSVMFISNQEYQNHLAGYELRKCPKLTVDGTGIVSLRERLFAVPARGRGHTLRKICRTSLPTRLSSIVGILTKSPLKRQQEVAQSLISALSNRSGIVDVLVDDLRMVFEGQFLEYLGT
jgi:GTPase Era involved in 16S rRNA processing